MKALLFFLIGVLAGAYAVHVYDERERPATSVSGMTGSVEDRLGQWHLSSDDIRADLARTGQVFREKAGVAGEKISDVRILAVIKAKYVLDRDLSARDIGVHVSDGAVTLTGTVSSPEFVGRATALALETDGATSVTARLSVQGGN